MFRSFFSKKKAVLTGVPAVRRMKTYSAQSGYVYQYFYEGHRDFRASGDSGMDFVFSISADRKAWHETSVLLSDAAVQSWEQDNQRSLTPTERYAVAKMALFQAFDERANPALLKDTVHIRPADIQAIVETLGL